MEFVGSEHQARRFRRSHLRTQSRQGCSGDAQYGTVAVQTSREMLEDAAFLCCCTEQAANGNLPELESSSSRAD